MPLSPVAWMYESERSCVGPFTERKVTFTLDRWHTVPKGCRETPLYTTPPEALTPATAQSVETLIDTMFPADEWDDLINYAYGEPMLAVNRETLLAFAHAVRAAHPDAKV